MSCSAAHLYTSRKLVGTGLPTGYSVNGGDGHGYSTENCSACGWFMPKSGACVNNKCLQGEAVDPEATDNKRFGLYIANILHFDPDNSQGTWPEGLVQRKHHKLGVESFLYGDPTNLSEQKKLEVIRLNMLRIRAQQGRPVSPSVTRHFQRVKPFEIYGEIMRGYEAGERDGRMTREEMADAIFAWGGKATSSDSYSYYLLMTVSEPTDLSKVNEEHLNEAVIAFLRSEHSRTSRQVILQRLLYNSTTPDDTVRQLAPYLSTAFVHSREIDRYMDHPAAINIAAQQYLAYSPFHDTRLAMAENDKTHESVLTTLLEDKDPAIRRAAIANIIRNNKSHIPNTDKVKQAFDALADSGVGHWEAINTVTKQGIKPFRRTPRCGSCGCWMKVVCNNPRCRAYGQKTDISPNIWPIYTHPMAFTSEGSVAEAAYIRQGQEQAVREYRARMEIAKRLDRKWNAAITDGVIALSNTHEFVLPNGSRIFLDPDTITFQLEDTDGVRVPVMPPWQEGQRWIRTEQRTMTPRQAVETVLSMYAQRGDLVLDEEGKLVSTTYAVPELLHNNRLPGVSKDYPLPSRFVFSREIREGVLRFRSRVRSEETEIYVHGRGSYYYVALDEATAQRIDAKKLQDIINRFRPYLSDSEGDNRPSNMRAVFGWSADDPLLRSYLDLAQVQGQRLQASNGLWIAAGSRHVLWSAADERIEKKIMIDPGAMELMPHSGAEIAVGSKGYVAAVDRRTGAVVEAGFNAGKPPNFFGRLSMSLSDLREQARVYDNWGRMSRPIQFAEGITPGDHTKARLQSRNGELVISSERGEVPEQVIGTCPSDATIDVEVNPVFLNNYMNTASGWWDLEFPNKGQMPIKLLHQSREHGGILMPAG